MNRVLLIVAAVGLALVLAQDASAGIGGRRCRPVYVWQAPAAAAPATAQAGQGYRAYSYEPMADEVVRYQAPGWRAGRRVGTRGHAYMNATNKALGRVN